MVLPCKLKASIMPGRALRRKRLAQALISPQWVSSPSFLFSYSSSCSSSSSKGFTLCLDYDDEDEYQDNRNGFEHAFG
jgi:hypothetical protein